MADPTRADKQPVHLSGQKARGGEIILRTRARWTIFLAGLVGIVLLALVLGLIAMR